MTVFARTLNEERLEVIDSYYGAPTNVFRNPVASEMAEIYGESGEAKGMLLRNGDVIVWSDRGNGSMEHTDAVSELRIPRDDVWMTFYMWREPASLFRHFYGHEVGEEWADVPTGVIKSSVSSRRQFGAFDHATDKWNQAQATKLTKIPGMKWLILPARIADLTSMKNVPRPNGPVESIVDILKRGIDND